MTTHRRGVRAGVVAGLLAAAACQSGPRRPVEAGTGNAALGAETELATVPLERLKERQWILRGFGAEAPPAGVEPTLTYLDVGFAGRGGCNRYRAAVTPGAAAGELTVGPVAATRMMCPEPAAAVEARFFAALARTTRFGMRGDRLVLIQGGPEDPGSLVFSEVVAPRR